MIFIMSLCATLRHCPQLSRSPKRRLSITMTSQKVLSKLEWAFTADQSLQVSWDRDSQSIQSLVIPSTRAQGRSTIPPWVNTFLVQDPFVHTRLQYDELFSSHLHNFSSYFLYHRMESTSLPMRIHCSERSAGLLRSQAPEIKLECRGVINVKGKGEMVTFWVGDDLICGEDLDLDGLEFKGELKD